VFAWALYALVLLLFATYPWLDRLARDAGRPDLALLQPFVVPPTLAALTASTVGAILASRRSRHPVGWLLLTIGLSMATGGVIAGYLPYTLIVRPGALPAVDLLARIYSPSADVALAALGFVLLLTPTGSAPSARWRRWGIAAAGAMALLLVAATVAPGSLDARTLTVEGPVGSRAFGGALRVANQLALPAAILIILGGAASLVTRFRHARGVERQQLRWVTLAAALTGVAMLATGSTTWTGSSAAPSPTAC
jgi:two-component system NarL family sensor kinase